MSDPNDHTSSAATNRAEELIAAIRGALAPDASDDAKAGAVSAARAILRGLEPPMRNGAPSANPAAAALAGTPLGAALGAISSIPREQVLEFLVGGLRSLLTPNGPTYRARPVATAPTSGGSDRGSQ